MGVLERPVTKSANPSTRWIEWNGQKGEFSYYDKEAKESVLIPLPLRFMVLEEYHTVGGWDDGDETGIYANEVLNIGKEELVVKNHKGKLIAEGLYKDIRPKVVASGGKYLKSIYIAVDGELMNLKIKGAAVATWNDFTDKDWRRLSEEFVAIKETEDKKKGSIKYKVPVFSFDKSASKKEMEVVLPLAQQLAKYVADKSGDETKEVVEKEVEKEKVPLEDLDF